MKSIDLPKAVIVPFAINLPAYVFVYFFNIDIYVPLLPALLFLSFVLIFLVGLSYWFLSSFSSQTASSGVWLGLILAIGTFVLDYVFFGFFMSEGSGFLRSNLSLVYLEMLIVPSVLGVYISGNKNT